MSLQLQLIQTELVSFTSCLAPAILGILRVLSFKAVSFVGANFLSVFFKLGEHQLGHIAPLQAGHEPTALLGLRRRPGLAGTCSPLGSNYCGPAWSTLIGPGLARLGSHWLICSWYCFASSHKP